MLLCLPAVVVCEVLGVLVAGGSQSQLQWRPSCCCFAVETAATTSAADTVGVSAAVIAMTDVVALWSKLLP